MPDALCSYCTKPTPEPEVEHAFPESWYPDGTAPSSMLTVPTCPECNDRYEKLEVLLLPKLMLCLGAGESAATKGILARLARSMNADRAKTDRDARARHAKKRRVFDSVQRGDR